MIFLNQKDLNLCLDRRALQEAMKQALASFCVGRTLNFPRAVVNTSEKTKAPLGFMAAVNAEKKLLGYKAITVFEGNSARNLNPHQGLVVLLDAETGLPKACLDANFITAARTAAVSAVATELLSREDSSTLAIIGAGTQALAHAEAISEVRPINTLAIHCRKQQSFETFCHALNVADLDIHRHPNAKEAVAHADIYPRNLEMHVLDFDILRH